MDELGVVNLFEKISRVLKTLAESVGYTLRVVEAHHKEIAELQTQVRELRQKLEMFLH